MKQKDDSGFTLVEVLIVMFIIGVLTIIVMVNFQHGRRVNELRQASTELMQDFRKAQNYSIGGNSIKYCREGSAANEFKPCDDDVFCGGAVGTCITSVPLGGYGIRVSSEGNYQVFGDTIANQVFDGSGNDYLITDNYISQKSLRLISFRLGLSVYDPDFNSLDVTFGPPTGNVYFYLDGVVAEESGQPINNLEILIQSDFISDICRKISINRISGQISEGQSACNL